MSTTTQTTTYCQHCGADREAIAAEAVMAGIDPAEAICCEDGAL